jgi:hypothetical protein
VSLEREIVGLSLAYALLGVLLLLAVTRARLPWPVKAGAIVLTSAFYAVAFFRTQDLLGWAARPPLPPQFQLLWARSVEPNHAAGDPGALYLWVEALDDANLPSGVPRAYRLPWSAPLARRVEAARDEIMQGRPQGGRAEMFGERSGQEMPAGGVKAVTGAEAGGDASTGGFDPDLPAGESQPITFAPLPAPKLPAKDLPPQ